MKMDNLDKYLPTTESQRFNSFDPWWCVPASLCNVLETEFNWMIGEGALTQDNLQWLIDNEYLDENDKVNFDDWFLARTSGTTPGQGNSFSVVSKAARKFGLTPQRKSPFAMNDLNNNLADYNQRVPKELYNLGKEFIKRFKLNYEVVHPDNFKKALDYNVLQVAVHAWRRVGNYYVSGNINHATMLIRHPWEVFDTYKPFIKQLEENYEFYYFGYQWYITENYSLLIKLMDYFIRLKNGAIFWGKGGTNKLQKITPSNAGMAAITHLTRMKGTETITIEDKDLKNYEVTGEFFGAS